MAWPRVPPTHADDARSRATLDEITGWSRQTASRAVQVDEAAQADERLIQRVDERLRREDPEVLNMQGRLRRSAVAKLIQRIGGVRLNRDQVD